MESLSIECRERKRPSSSIPLTKIDIWWGEHTSEGGSTLTWKCAPGEAHFRGEHISRYSSSPWAIVLPWVDSVGPWIRRLCALTSPLGFPRPSECFPFLLLASSFPVAGLNSCRQPSRDTLSLQLVWTEVDQTSRLDSAIQHLPFESIPPLPPVVTDRDLKDSEQLDSTRAGFIHVTWLFTQLEA